MDGIRFRFHYRIPDYRIPDYRTSDYRMPDSISTGAAARNAKHAKTVESLHVRVPLLGRHSVHTALRAAAVGLVEGLSWEEIVAGMQNMPGQIRLVAASGINGSTVIDDTYNASPASTTAALNLLHDLQPDGSGRRVAVLGDMRELGDYTDEGHQLVGRRAADVADLLVTVGELGQSIGAEAIAAGLSADQVYTFSGASETIDFLRHTLRSGDLVLVKGSRAVSMEVIAQEITIDVRARQASAHA
jgi:UDP-N-acetylmuramoyl-tripeptide--D-alanyl-D-alanine ligase